MKKLTQIPFTKEGFEEVKKRYQEVLSSKKEAIDTLTRAREMGDLSENGFYKAAKGRLMSIYSEIRHLERVIRIAEVTEPKEGIAGVGTKVTVNDGTKTRIFYIVGKFETDPLKRKISNESPIGKELIGKKVGDEVLVKTPKGELNYKILEIN